MVTAAWSYLIWPRYFMKCLFCMSPSVLPCFLSLNRLSGCPDFLHFKAEAADELCHTVDDHHHHSPTVSSLSGAETGPQFAVNDHFIPK